MSYADCGHHHGNLHDNSGGLWYRTGLAKEHHPLGRCYCTQDSRISQVFMSFLSINTTLTQYQIFRIHTHHAATADDSPRWSVVPLVSGQNLVPCTIDRIYRGTNRSSGRRIIQQNIKSHFNDDWIPSRSPSTHPRRNGRDHPVSLIPQSHTF